MGFAKSSPDELGKKGWETGLGQSMLCGKVCQRTDHRSSFFLVLNYHGTLDATVSGIECREVDVASPTISKGKNTCSLGFKILKCPRNIQEAFAPTTDHSNGGPSKFSQVSGDIHGVLPTAVDASKSSSPEDFNSCSVGKKHGASDSRASIELTAGEALGNT